MGWVDGASGMGRVMGMEVFCAVWRVFWEVAWEKGLDVTLFSMCYCSSGCGFLLYSEGIFFACQPATR